MLFALFVCNLGFSTNYADHYKKILESMKRKGNETFRYRCHYSTKKLFRIPSENITSNGSVRFGRYPTFAPQAPLDLVITKI